METEEDRRDPMEEDDSGSEFEELGESICAICDDGGNMLCCDGPCLRAFHPTKRAAAESTSRCRSLCLDDSEVQQQRKFYCENCKLRRHQCAYCGKLGKSAEPEQEVYLCDVGLCGRFYHLECVSKLLKQQVSSEGFTCPVHRCWKCGKRERTDDEAFRLYPCRRCPRAWHRQCVDGSIRFNDEEGEDGARGWLIGDTRFLYCVLHELVPEFNTPRRDHIVFPHLKSFALPKRQKQSVEPQLKQTVEPLVKPLDGRVKLPTPPVARAKGPVFDRQEVDDVVLKIIAEANEKVVPEVVAQQLVYPSTVRKSTNKQVQLGKIESMLRALQKASDCLARGGSVEDAQCLFPAQHLKLFENARDSLKVYLSPIVYGMRYSSYGRHFTQASKLQEIVGMLQWYVEPGDTIVDFCCGSNDFSRLMSAELERANKRCFFRNFDIIQPDNTSNFERRDYMTITKSELPDGDKLIIGLNPPFGYRAQLASKFVEHSASFFPKLIITIAPPETRNPGPKYEMIWRNETLLRGQAFYLPGSVDIHGKIINQENNNPPVLTLWSHKDFLQKHRLKAIERGHMGSGQRHRY